MSVKIPWEKLISDYVEATSAYGTREAGEFINVSRQKISEWRRGERPEPVPETKRALVDFFARGGIDRIRDGRGTLKPSNRFHLEQLIREIGDPGELDKVKLRFLESWKETWSAAGIDTPDWYFELRGRIDAGKL